MAVREYYRDSYIEGNVVRKAIPKERVAMPEKSREQIIQERNRRLAAKRNRKAALAINGRYVAFLLAATIVCCSASIAFLHVQSNITTHMSQVAEMQKELNSLKTQNEALESHLATTMTIDEIKDRATALGLVYPGADQVMTYSVENTDYMNQYSDISSK